MTALVGGLRSININYQKIPHGVFTSQQGALNNDFFVNILDLGTKWKAASDSDDIFEGHDRRSGDFLWSATRVDLIFGSNSELRAIAEVYASDDAEVKFIRDFIGAWTKVMNLR